MIASPEMFENERRQKVQELLHSSWVRTNAPVVLRTDDIWFVDAKTGWAVNGNGQILKTTDAGESWIEQAKFDATWLRCIGFADAQNGWVGTVGGTGKSGAPLVANRLLRTTDGGANWHWVTLPDAAPARVCGLCVVDEKTIYLSGTNDPKDAPGVMKSVDGGATWTSIPLSDKASLIVDILFNGPSEGWVVGGVSARPSAGVSIDRDDVIPVVLHTTDGGLNWVNLASQPELVRQFPRGEWGWKIQYLAPSTLLVALENEHDGAILRSDDRGVTWARLKLNDRQRNSNLEGIGFLTQDIGWVGGWGDIDGKTGSTSMTIDGGANWRDANEVGRNLNRFRFIGNPVHTVFASGDTVYRLAVGQKASRTPPVAPTSAPPEDPFTIPIRPAKATGAVVVTIWDRFGSLVQTLSGDIAQAGEPLDLTWDLKGASGARVRSGPYIVRVSVDHFTYGVLINVSHAGAATVFGNYSEDLTTPSPGKTGVGSTESPGFDSEIRPLFRDFDRSSMMQAFDLFDYTSVKANAPAILARLKDGSMPCDAPWRSDMVALFQRWIDQGMKK